MCFCICVGVNNNFAPGQLEFIAQKLCEDFLKPTLTYSAVREEEREVCLSYSAINMARKPCCKITDV